MIVDLRANSRGLFLQAKLSGSVKNGANALFRQVFQWCVATPRPRQRNVGAECFGKSGRIDLNLRHITVGVCSSEEFAIAPFDEDVKHGLIERGVCGVPMSFPASIDQIDFNATAPRFLTIYADGGVAEIRAGFAIPGPNLNDVDPFASRANKVPSEFTSEPSRLKFQFIRYPKWQEERALMDARAEKQFGIARAVRGVRHGGTFQL